MLSILKILMGNVAYLKLKLYLWQLDITLSYSFNYIPSFIFYDAHVKSVKHTELVRLFTEGSLCESSRVHCGA